MREQTKPCETPCAKCGSVEVIRKLYIKGSIVQGEAYGKCDNRFASGNTHYFESVRDHLDHQCKVCGYRWQTLPMAKPKKADKEELSNSESIIESLLQHGTVSITKWDHDNTYSATLKTVFGIERVMVPSGYRHRSQLSAVAGLKKQHEASKGER